jgi:hypothetical protein
MGRNAAAMAVVAVVLLASAAFVVAQAPPAGGQRPQIDPKVMASFMYLERTWTAVSFQLGCTSQQIASLKPTYQNALVARDAAVKKAMAAQNWQAAGKASVDCMTRLQAKLKQVLSSSQVAKLQQLLAPPAGMRGPSGAGKAG